jgi:hypothetical protein
MRRLPCLTLALALSSASLLETESSLASGIADVPLRRGDLAGARFSATGTASPQSTAVKTLAFVPTLSGAWRLNDRWMLSADLAASLTSYRFAGSHERSGVARVANPMLGVELRAFESERLRLRLGGAAGAPLLTVPGGITRNAAAEHADRAATAATGQRVYWLWARNVVPAVLLGRLEYAIEELLVRVDLEPGLLVSVNRDPTSIALLGAFETAIRLGPLSPGLRLTSLVTSRERDTHDFSQTTAAAFLCWDGDAIFADVEAVTGVDGPQGLSRDDQTSWGVTLGAGARF